MNPETPSPAAPVSPLGKLAEALAKAQGVIKAPLKTRKVDFTDKNGRRVHYNYADLADLLEAVKEPLSANGLSTFHRMECTQEGDFHLITTLLHTSGDQIFTTYPLPDPRDIKPQEFGSSLTFARRYSLSALLSVASEEDDDGAIAESPGPKVAPKATQSPPGSIPKPIGVANPQAIAPKAHIESQAPRAGTVSEAQRKHLAALAADRHWSPEEITIYMNDHWSVANSKDLTQEQFKLLVFAIENTAPPHSDDFDRPGDAT